MRLCVFGASGPVGRAVVEQALAAGYEVKAVTRRPDEFGPSRAGLRVFGADVYDKAQVSTALDGADAVISAIGVNPGRERVTTYSTGIANIIDGMRVRGLSKVACVSSKELDESGVSDEPLLYRFVFAHLLALINRTVYADMRRMEQVLRDSSADLDWTIIRPGGLYAAQQVTRYQVVRGHAPGVKTSVADLADALLREVTAQGQHVREVVTVLTHVGAPAYLKLIFGQRALHQK